MYMAVWTSASGADDALTAVVAAKTPKPVEKRMPVRPIENALIMLCPCLHPIVVETGMPIKSDGTLTRFV